MARPPALGSVIVPDWHESAEGKEYLACILRKNRRRVFGKCSRPSSACQLSFLGENSVTCCFLGGARKQGSEGLLHCAWGPLEALSLGPPPANLLRANSIIRARNVETGKTLPGTTVTREAVD